MSLPACSIQFPTCGACHAETEHDGESFYCEDCDLDYGDGGDGEEAIFRDSNVSPCGKPCDNEWHQPHKIRQGIGFECSTCKLPETHKGDCWTDCPITKIDGDPNE